MITSSFYLALYLEALIWFYYRNSALSIDRKIITHFMQIIQEFK